MPPEPQRSIEELLQRSAETRRAAFGDDPTMPNPMRARLHDEIRLRAASHGSSKQRRWLNLSWPRLTLASACAILLLTLAIFWPRERQRRELSLVTPRVSQQLALRDKTETTASAASSVATAAHVLGADMLSAPEFFRAGAAPAESGALNFRQQLQPNESRTSNVLSNFQVQQIGQNIRVTDQDGSTYVGTIEHLAAKDTRNLAAQSQLVAKARGESSAARENEAKDQFYIRAQGVNRTLQKSLVLEGSYIVAAPSSTSTKDNKAKNVLPAQARIVGTARIAGEAPQQIDAVSTPAR